MKSRLPERLKRVAFKNRAILKKRELEKEFTSRPGRVLTNMSSDEDIATAGYYGVRDQYHANHSDPHGLDLRTTKCSKRMDQAYNRLVTLLRRCGKERGIKVKVEPPNHNNWKRMLLLGLLSDRGLNHLVNKVVGKAHEGYNPTNVP